MNEYDIIKKKKKIITEHKQENRKNAVRKITFLKLVSHKN